MLLFLHGNDPYLIQRRKQELTKAFLKKYPEGELALFDFEDQGSAYDVRKSLSFGDEGLFASRKLIVILHPIGIKEEAVQVLKEFLEKGIVSEFATFLFVQSKTFRKNDKLANLLKRSVSKEEVCDAPIGRDLEKWVRTELKSISPNIQIGDEALRDLIRATKGELSRLSSEIEKLALFSESGEITSESIDILVEFAREEVLFQALDALSRDEKGKALLLFRAEETGGESIYPLLSMCAWQMRRLLLVREGYEQGMRGSSEIASYAGLQPFAAERALRFIGGLPISRLKKSLTLLSEIDTSLKSGKLEPGTALNLFVWKF